MKCNNCGQILPEDAELCPYCGATEIIANTCEEETLCVEKKPKKVWKVILGVILGLLFLVVAFFMVIIILSSTVKNVDGKRVENPYSDMLAIFRDNDIKCRGCYSDELEDALEEADEVIATVGDYTLTNGQLQVYYWMQVYDYLESVSNTNFDYKSPLYEQYYSEAEDLSWEQYFIERAIETWNRYAILNIMAENENFKLSQEDLDYLDVYRTSMETSAKNSGFADADAMVQSDFGETCDFEDYMSYINLFYTAGKYIETKESMLSPSMEQIEAYYDAHAEAFLQAGYEKKDKDVVAVRHILIQLKDGELDAYNRAKYTDEQWEQCRQEAQAVLDKWLENPTEENFGELAKTYSVDGSASKGGLYTDVEKGMMVETFDSWIFDDARVKGDSGLVKTVYGYHVMFFVSREQKQGDWVELAKTEVISEQIVEMIEKTEETYVVEVDYKDIVLVKKVVGE